MSFVSESFSSGFGVIEGETPEQTLIGNPHFRAQFHSLKYSGGIFPYNNRNYLFQNKGLKQNRQSLGLYFFDEENEAQDNFPNILAPPFAGISKQNLVTNGDCKYAEDVYYAPKYYPNDDSDELTAPNNNGDEFIEGNIAIALKPQGEWGFLNFNNLYRAFDYSDVQDSVLQYYPQIQTANPFNNNMSYITSGDEQGNTGYGGYFSYVPLSDNSIRDNYWKNIYKFSENSYKGGYALPYYMGKNMSGTNINLMNFIQGGTVDIPLTQNEIYDFLNVTEDEYPERLNELRSMYKIKLNGIGVNKVEGTQGNDVSDALPTIATWIQTNEAFSNNRCLCFCNYELWDETNLNNFFTINNTTNSWIFNYLCENFGESMIPSEQHNKGKLITAGTQTMGGRVDNNYRTLNQVQKIYDKFNDTELNPNSSLKIRFKMKTTHVLPSPAVTFDKLDDFLSEPLKYAPKVEIGVLESQWDSLPTPLSGSGQLENLEGDEFFKSSGNFNSSTYFNIDDFENKKYSQLGGFQTFQNDEKTLDRWQNFEFTFNLNENHLNRGLIYGVPYGGSFNNDLNLGTVELVLNRDAIGEDNNFGDILFKRQDHLDTDSPGRNQIHLRSPRAISSLSSQNLVEGREGPVEVTMTHNRWAGNPNVNNINDYSRNVVYSALGDTTANEVRTGLQKDGTFLEAYLMWIGLDYIPENPTKQSAATDFAMDVDTTNAPNIVVAYWNGVNWSYDSGNSGYEPIDNKITPEINLVSSGTTFKERQNCFIIARLYSDEAEGDGITGIDLYIDNSLDYPQDGIGNLYLYLQSGEDFYGRVLIDDIECFESYEFMPDVDVRKRKGVNDFGVGDLTKYYDKDLQPDEYKDTTAPLEAQFYFYPLYPVTTYDDSITSRHAEDVFSIEKTPIYEDFRRGKFYIYDVDWGDGSPKEFTSTPEPIGENIALYHTYETHGIFEITGTMLRVKTDKDNNILGVYHNKRFNLFININEGVDEDFELFGSSGYSFIPYKNTTPVIGGISSQGNYYKRLKRQLGFLQDEKIKIDFKNISDKLKTENALFKAKVNEDDFSNEELEILPSYIEPLVSQSSSPYDEVDDGDTIINNGYKNLSGELGKSIGDIDLQSIKYYNDVKQMYEILGFKDEDSLDEIEETLIQSNEELFGSDINSPGENGITGSLVYFSWEYDVNPNTSPFLTDVEFTNIQTIGDFFYYPAYNSLTSTYPLINGDLSNPYDLELVPNSIRPYSGLDFSGAWGDNVNNISIGENIINLLNLQFPNNRTFKLTTQQGSTMLFKITGGYAETINFFGTEVNSVPTRYAVEVIESNKVDNHDDIMDGDVVTLTEFVVDTEQVLGLLPEINDKILVEEKTLIPVNYNNFKFLGNLPDDNLPNLYNTLRTYGPDNQWFSGNMIQSTDDKLYFGAPFYETFFNTDMQDNAALSYTNVNGNMEYNGIIYKIETEKGSYIKFTIEGYYSDEDGDHISDYSFNQTNSDLPKYAPIYYFNINVIESYILPNVSIHVGNPTSKRYWKNIINKNTSIFEREGLLVELLPGQTSNLNIVWNNDDLPINRNNIPNRIISIISLKYGAAALMPNGTYQGSLDILKKGEMYSFQISGNESFFWDKLFRETIDVNSEQDWLDGSYYPVLPRYGQSGRFINNLFPNNKIPFSINGLITDENDFDENLKINVVNQKVTTDVLKDISGKENNGFLFEDYNPKFDDENLRVEKIRIKSNVKSSKVNGAF